MNTCDEKLDAEDFSDKREQPKNCDEIDEIKAAEKILDLAWCLLVVEENPEFKAHKRKQSEITSTNYCTKYTLLHNSNIYMIILVVLNNC